MVSAYILLNINHNIALIIIIILLAVSTFFEYKLYKNKSDN